MINYTAAEIRQQFGSAGHGLRGRFIVELLVQLDQVTQERDAALLEIYGLQEAQGTGSLRILADAFDECRRDYPHVMTPGMRFVRDMREVASDGG